MEILKAGSAKVANGLIFLERFVDKQFGSRFGKSKSNPMALPKAPGKFIHELSRDNALLLPRIGQNLVQLTGGVIHQVASDSIVSVPKQKK